MTEYPADRANWGGAVPPRRQLSPEDAWDSPTASSPATPSMPEQTEPLLIHRAPVEVEHPVAMPIKPVKRWATSGSMVLTLAMLGLGALAVLGVLGGAVTSSDAGLAALGALVTLGLIAVIEVPWAAYLVFRREWMFSLASTISFLALTGGFAIWMFNAVT